MKQREEVVKLGLDRLFNQVILEWTGTKRDNLQVLRRQLVRNMLVWFIKHKTPHDVVSSFALSSNDNYVMSMIMFVFVAAKTGGMEELDARRHAQQFQEDLVEFMDRTMKHGDKRAQAKRQMKSIVARLATRLLDDMAAMQAEDLAMSQRVYLDYAPVPDNEKSLQNTLATLAHAAVRLLMLTMKGQFPLHHAMLKMGEYSKGSDADDEADSDSDESSDGHVSPVDTPDGSECKAESAAAQLLTELSTLQAFAKATHATAQAAERKADDVEKKMHVALNSRSNAAENIAEAAEKRAASAEKRAAAAEKRVAAAERRMQDVETKMQALFRRLDKTDNDNAEFIARNAEFIARNEESNARNAKRINDALAMVNTLGQNFNGAIKETTGLVGLITDRMTAVESRAADTDDRLATLDETTRALALAQTPVAASAPPPPEMPVDVADRLERLDASMRRVTSEVAWMLPQFRFQFVERWNGVMAQWQLQQELSTPFVPAPCFVNAE